MIFKRKLLRAAPVTRDVTAQAAGGQNMKNVRLIRKDESAVSPVIATILMVAITVVLAAVLYVMVSGLISGPGAGPQAMGVTVSRSSDGQNWVLLVSSTRSGKTYSLARLTVFRTDGTTNLTATPFANLDVAGEGCALQQA